MKFCEKLVKLRKENNLSQEQLADKLGMSRQAISKWESGTSRPDMEKMLEICKVLNCSIDQLLDDGAISNNEFITNTKININEWIDDLLNFITKTYNMFCSMKFLEKIKCLMELGFIILLIFSTWSLIGMILGGFIFNILDLLPEVVYTILKDILECIYSLIGLALGLIIFIHLFKIRYLDYFITVEDSDIQEKIIEEPIDEIKNHKTDKLGNIILEKKKEKVIIRDPKHSTYSFFSLLGKVAMFFIKIFALITAFFLICSFIAITFCETVSLWYIKEGLFFIGISLAGSGVLLLNYIALEVIYNLVLNRKYNFRKIFLLIIVGLLAIGSGFGISFARLTTFEVLDNNSTTYETKKELITMQDDLSLLFLDHYNSNIIIDNNEQNIRVEIKYLEGLDYSLTNYTCGYYTNEDYLEYNCYDIYYNANGLTYFNLLLEDLKNEILRSDYWTYDDYKVTVYLSEANWQKLKNNLN